MVLVGVSKKPISNRTETETGKNRLKSDRQKPKPKSEPKKLNRTVLIGSVPVISQNRTEKTEPNRLLI